MNTVKKNHERVRNLVGVSLFTAIVFVLQYFSEFLKLGIFSSASFALIAIVVGAALYGAYAGAWLGFIMGVAVLVSGDAAPFMPINMWGTVITVLVKGTAAGFAAGFIYRKLESKNQIIASLLAAAASPIVNTGIFLLGCRVFFFKSLSESAAETDNPTLFAAFFIVCSLMLTFFAAVLTYNIINRNKNMSAAAAASAAGVANIVFITCLSVILCSLILPNIGPAHEGVASYNTWAYILITLVGVNFIIEFAVNVVLNPTIIRLINIGKKINK